MARIVGIDLGSYSVKVIHLEPKGRGGFEVLAYGEAFVPPVADGNPSTPPSAAEPMLDDRHSVALAELKHKGLLEGDVFVTGLPGGAAAVRTLRFPFNDQKKIAEALPFALESEIPLDLDEIVLSWSVLGPSARAKKDESNETDVLVAWARKEAVQNVLNLLAVHGVDPRHVEFDALALDDLYDGLLKDGRREGTAAKEGPTELRTQGGTVIELGEGAPDPATAIVDIGHRRTTVCVLAGDRVVSAHTILHGGADATRALAKAIGLSLAEAERGKRKEAFIEVAGARAQFPEQLQISEVLKTAYAPIVRRLRQIFQSTISVARVRVVKVILVGGGSRVLNVDRHLAEELNVKVARGRELAHAMRGQLPDHLAGGHFAAGDAGDEGAPEAALAFAYALSASLGNKSRARIDFRAGEFAWKGDYEFLREKAPALAAWAACLVLLLGASGVARAYVLGSTEGDLVKQELALCADITGQANIDSFQRCLAMIQERINGKAGFQVPERSAADTYLEITRRLPPASELKRKVTELDITAERVKMRGLTSKFEDIDTMVERLQGGRCFSLVEKGKAQNKGSDIEFNIAITLDCVAALGDGGVKASPATPGATSTTPSTTGVAAGAGTKTTPTASPPRMEPPAASVADHPARGDTLRTDTAVAPAQRERVPSADGEAEVRGSKLSPEEIAARRERLKKLREEREARRANRGPDGLSPLTAPRNPAMRERLLKGKATDGGAPPSPEQEP
jgi:general secretion pathway protein L